MMSFSDDGVCVCDEGYDETGVESLGELGERVERDWRRSTWLLFNLHIIAVRLRAASMVYGAGERSCVLLDVVPATYPVVEAVKVEYYVPPPSSPPPTTSVVHLSSSLTAAACGCCC